MLPSDICNQINTDSIFDSRLRQCASKQAASIVNGTLTKRRKQLYMLSKLQKKGKDTKFLQRKIDCFKPSVPDASQINIELDQRFVDFKQTKDGYFDFFIRLSSIGNKEEILIPIKHNKVSRRWLKKGKLKTSIRLTEEYIGLFYEIPDISKKTVGKKLGADQGMKTCLTLSDGQITPKDSHGYDLDTICAKLRRRQAGSKGFQRAKAHRKNYINWALNQLDFSTVKEILLEKIVNIRNDKSCKNKLRHWTYTDIKSKLLSLSETEGFSLIEQDNKFRSQRCFRCSWTHKLNRKGKTFKCSDCGHEMDADLNAASNHSIELCDISHHKVWYDHLNRSSGFYWLKEGVFNHSKEPIVPCVQKE
jgi:transposase